MISGKGGLHISNLKGIKWQMAKADAGLLIFFCMINLKEVKKAINVKNVLLHFAMPTDGWDEWE